MDEMQASKRSRIDANGWSYEAETAAAAAAKLGHKEKDADKDGGLGKTSWYQHSSRICRVSRASGGKDRHSKVLTAKGLRDRRVRLSVSTAIQFYDLQDRLGVDQPSKAVEWLINAASAAISELPELDGPFPDPDMLMLEEKSRGELKDDDQNDYTEERQQQPHLSLTKSACSSTSETSKGSVLSLSRSEIRVKARERAKERTTKEKEKKEEDGDDVHHYRNHQSNLNHNPNTQSSFTELLTGVGSGHGHGSVTVAQAHPGDNGSDFYHKQIRHLQPVAAMTDYFSQAGLFGQGQKPHQPPGFPAQTHFGNSSSIGMLPFNAAAAAAASGEHPEMQQQFSFLPDHLIPVAAVAAGGEYNLNFSISSGLAGFNRGTLQSNSPSPMPHHHQSQRLSSPVDGSSLPFFLSAPSPATPTTGENHFPSGYDSRLQLYYGDGFRSTDLKGKGKG